MVTLMVFLVKTIQGFKPIFHVVINQCIYKLYIVIKRRHALNKITVVYEYTHQSPLSPILFSIGLSVIGVK